MYKKPNFFLRSFSFSGKMEREQFGSDLGVRLISFLCAAIILCILITLTVPGDTEYLSSVVEAAVLILSIFWIIPIIAMTRRRLRDAGRGAKSYLWLLLPVIGLIIFIALLCAPSAES